jgi:putative oxidoreductase
MKGRIVLAVRIVLGLIFVVFGLNGLFEFFKLPGPTTQAAKEFFDILMPSHYLTAVKFIEITGGALLVLGIFPIVGLALITPIVANILLYEVLLEQKPGPAFVLVPMVVVLIWGYWRYIKSIFTILPQVEKPTS